MGDLLIKEVFERICFYIVRKGKYWEVYFVNSSYKWVGGGMLFIFMDFIKMVNVLLNDNFLDFIIREELWMLILLDNGEMNL